MIPGPPSIPVSSLRVCLQSKHCIAPQCPGVTWTPGPIFWTSTQLTSTTFGKKSPGS